MLAKLFSKIQSPIEFSLCGEVMHLMLVLPFSWKLFFFSALLFTLGAILYSSVAPSIIKDNSSFGEFLTNRKKFSHIDRYREELGINDEMVKKLGINRIFLMNAPGYIPLVDTEFEIKHFKRNWRNKRANEKLKVFQRTDQYQYASKKDTKEENMENSFWTVYNFANDSRKLLLVLTLLFYLAGFIMILIVFIQSIIEVVKWV